MLERPTLAPNKIKKPPMRNAMVVAMARHTAEATAERAKGATILRTVGAMLVRAWQQQRVREEKYWEASKYNANKTRLICAGLVGIGILIVQAFVQIGVFTTSAGTPPSKVPDVPAIISVMAFAIALPLLSVRLLVSFEVASRKIMFGETLGLRIAYWFGTFLALVGIATAFWHVWPVAGVLVSVMIVIGFYSYTGYGKRINRCDEQLKDGGIENKRFKEEENASSEMMRLVARLHEFLDTVEQSEESASVSENIPRRSKL